MTKAEWEQLWSHCHLQGRLDENQDEILYMNRYECLPHHSCVFLEEVGCETCLTLLNVWTKVSGLAMSETTRLRFIKCNLFYNKEQDKHSFLFLT